MRLRVDATAAPWAAETCERAFTRTGSRDARVIQARALLIAGDLDRVVTLAASSANFPLLWHLAGDAEFEAGNLTRARLWYLRALQRHRVFDPARGANTAARLAEIDAAGGSEVTAARFRQLSTELARWSANRPRD